MNIKLKALLMSLGSLLTVFGLVYILVFNPMLIMVLGSTFLVYFVYKLILNELETKEGRK